jgi:hypothetical protein
MGFRFRRSIKLFPGLRLNFGKRGISTSIGVRSAHVTYGPTGTRTTVGLPGTGLSYTHLDKPHRDIQANQSDAERPPGYAATQGSALRGLLWIGLIVVALAVATNRPAPPVPLPSPAESLAPTTTPGAIRSAGGETTAEIKRAARGAAQIRGTIANARSLKFTRITVMRDATICYRFNLRNSRGAVYARTAMMDGEVLKVSQSEDFATLWNSRCTAASLAHDITIAELPGQLSTANDTLRLKPPTCEFQEFLSFCQQSVS